MNALDIIILISLALGFLLGWKLRAFRLLGLITAIACGIWIANHFDQPILSLCTPASPATAQIIIWCCLFLATWLSFMVLGGMFIQALQAHHLIWLDQFLGALLMSLVVLVALAISLAGLNLQANASHWPIIKKSHLAPVIVKISQPLFKKSLETSRF